MESTLLLSTCPCIASPAASLYLFPFLLLHIPTQITEGRAPGSLYFFPFLLLHIPAQVTEMGDWAYVCFGFPMTSQFRTPFKQIELMGRVSIGYRKNIQNSFFGRLLNGSSIISQEISRIRARRPFSVSMVARKVTKRETVVPDPDYRISLVLLGLAGGLAYEGNLLPAAPAGLLGLLLLFQTTRVRFVFDEEALEVKVGDQLQESGENVFVGGKNRWKYSTFVNWELWWPRFPILVYFKETQTKPEGQVHFFPVIFNGKQLYDVMVERAGPSKTSGPKQS